MGRLGVLGRQSLPGVFVKDIFLNFSFLLDFFIFFGKSYFLCDILLENHDIFGKFSQRFQKEGSKSTRQV